MKKKHFVLAIISLLSVSSVAFADRQLDRAEILQIFEKLTSQPRKTWIPAGTIKATHQEYKAPRITDLDEINDRISEKIQEYQNNPNKRELTKNLQKMNLDAIPFNIRYRLSNEYTMNSTVVVRFDGDRFYWEIDVNSRTDSVKPGTDLEGNFMTNQFNLDLTARRIYAWDGERYTIYSRPVNNAIVTSTGNIPHSVNGPLTAGFIPWGYGYNTYENLSAAESSAVETSVDGQTQIRLILNYSDDLEVVFVMDLEKDYAVISCTTTGPGIRIISNHYSDYQLLSGNWIPTTILIEQYNAGTNRLLASDLWYFTSISGEAPGPEDFNVKYKADALVEYFTPVTSKSVRYRYSEIVDIDLLLAERLAFAASEGIQPQNCATAALKYAASQLGKDVTDQQLVQLINGTDKATTLYAMKEFAQSKGFYCRAVKTDIQTLKGLSGCQVILHIPGKNHFIVLEGIDAGYVWSIDLASDKFYYRTDLSFFGMDWTEGTALLISNQPVQIQGNFTEIADAQLGNIIGGSGYSCTRLLQDFEVVSCVKLGCECYGWVEIWFPRWGCEAAPSGGCTSSVLLRYIEKPCIDSPYYYCTCAVTGEWTERYMRACY
jgi:hypothetical protein